MTEGSDKLDFLDETAPAPEPQIEAAPEPEATGEPEVVPPTTEVEKPQAIPITALLDEREKRQAAERRAEENERRLRMLEQRLSAPPQQAPDWFEKPDEALRARMAPLQAELLNTRLDTSELMAAQAYGQDIVETAKQAFLAEAQRDPALHQKVLQSRHPYDEVVKWHKKTEAMAKIGDDPDAFINAEVERRLQERLTQSSPAPAPRPPISLAAAPAAGRTTPIAKGNAFDQAFPV